MAAYCGSTDTVAWADSLLARVHASLGDVAAAAVLSLAWAQAGEEQAGGAGDVPEARLGQVCATGAWLAAVGFERGGAGVTLSPGDIDEALFAVLTPLSPSQGEAVRSSSFERAEALRTGLLGGLEAC